MSTHPHGPRSLPPQPTSFIGRQTELADIDQRLGDPACRLLTITGPGGVGKTRLAIEAAARQEKRFADGVAFVALQAVASAREIALAIAGKTGLTLPGGAEPEIQILTALQRRHALFVLDTFEHLLDAAPLLSELLRAAPAVTLLVTSREALQLQEEWRYPLHGLPAPDDPGQVSATDADALRLFAERARRARPDFSLEAEREAVARICRLVDGLPLAIELAAPWTAALPTIDIAAEIERDLSLLATHLRNVPERHRSVRAIFEQTWHRLPDEERAVFRQLAVFRGGFQRDAASVVAGATLPILASLVARSLLRCEADGRYHLHELVRQYALEQLRADADALATTEARHRDYFMAFLADQGQAMVRGRLREALGDIAAELDNVRIAWSQPLVDIDGPALQRAIAALANFYHLRGRYREGFALLEEMVRRLRERPSKDGRAGALAAALLDLGQFATRLGRFAEARAALDEARLLYAALDAPLPVGLATDPEIGLGVLELTEGNAAAAARLGETVRARATAEGNSGNLPYAWYLIAQAALADRSLDEARQAAEAAAAAARRSGDDWFLAYCLNDLGAIAAALGNTSVARQNYQASLDLREAFDDLEGMAVGLVHLGRLAIRTGDFAGARRCFRRAQMLYDDIGDRGGLAAALHGLGQAADGSGEAAEAARHVAQALSIAIEIGFTPRALAIVPDAAALLLAAGEAAPAELLLTVARHPAADRETRERARGLLSRAGQGHDPNLPLDEEQPGQAADPVPLVAQLQADLLALGERPEGQRSVPPPVQPLPDPLTERELVVLRLIAGGRSNQQIADELFLAVSTVKWYASQIFGKLAVRNRTEAAARARELAILP